MRPQWSVKDHKVLSAFAPLKSDTTFGTNKLTSVKFFLFIKKLCCFNHKPDANAFQAKKWIN